ncbi:MAG TPA: preQ(1) synthase [Fibrobacteraceae bacterium]|nr:preQ(1) synthase [Fibrobacteraceae bacterium]
MKKSTRRPPQHSPHYLTGAPGSYEGLQMWIPSMPTPVVETWEFQYPGSNTDLTIEIPEFTCVCPKTGLPDFATLIVQYTPNKLCMELKSLKEYILFYRNLGIFHEHVVNRMLRDLAKACKPKKMTITGVFNARGGIQTTVQATL